MVKRVFITLEDSEYNKLVKEKGNLTWKEFVFKLLEFKRKAEEEEETLHKEALKEPYMMQAQALRAIGKLMKFGTEDLTLQREYEQAALLPLYVSGVELSEWTKSSGSLKLSGCCQETKRGSMSLALETFVRRSVASFWLTRPLRRGSVELTLS